MLDPAQALINLYNAYDKARTLLKNAKSAPKDAAKLLDRMQMFIGGVDRLKKNNGAQAFLSRPGISEALQSLDDSFCEVNLFLSNPRFQSTKTLKNQALQLWHANEDIVALQALHEKLTVAVQGNMQC